MSRDLIDVMGTDAGAVMCHICLEDRVSGSNIVIDSTSDMSRDVYPVGGWYGAGGTRAGCNELEHIRRVISDVLGIINIR